MHVMFNNRCPSYLKRAKIYDIVLFSIDYRKAFDSVPNRPLIEKLEGVGLNPHIANSLAVGLPNLKKITANNCRWFNIIINKSFLLCTTVFLSRILAFLIYTDSITEVELSSNSRFVFYNVMYADDVLIYSAISSTADYQLLQRDIDVICDWFTEENLTQNPQI